MGEWIISVVGVIALGILLEIILPEGQTNKYVKGAFSLLVIFVIVSPLVKWKGGQFAFNIDKAIFDIDKEFITDTVSEEIKSLESDMEDFLAVNGYDAEVKLSQELDKPVAISKVHIIVKIQKPKENELNKHIETIKKLISNKFNVAENKIFVETQIIDGGDYGSD